MISVALKSLIRMGAGAALFAGLASASLAQYGSNGMQQQMQRQQMQQQQAMQRQQQMQQQQAMQQRQMQQQQVMQQRQQQMQQQQAMQQRQMQQQQVMQQRQQQMQQQQAMQQRQADQQRRANDNAARYRRDDFNARRSVTVPMAQPRSLGSNVLQRGRSTAFGSYPNAPIRGAPTRNVGANEGRGFVSSAGVAKLTRPLTPGEIKRGFTGKITADGRALVRFQGRVFAVPSSGVSGLVRRTASQGPSSRWTPQQRQGVNASVQALLATEIGGGGRRSSGGSSAANDNVRRNASFKAALAQGSAGSQLKGRLPPRTGFANSNYHAAPKPEDRRVVIGRMDDVRAVGAVRPNQIPVAAQLSVNQGSPKANYKKNMSVLRSEMAKGYPIADLSAHKADGDLSDSKKNPQQTVRQTFTGAERNQLRNRDWTFDGENWNPPK